MKFEIHKKLRWGDFEYSEEEYQKANLEYLEHLMEISFDNSPQLLKYFGYSFFHDTSFEKVDLNTEKSCLTLILRRNDDIEDINYLLEEQNLPEIEWDNYDAKPILYKCIFFNAQFKNGEIKNFLTEKIIDSEINLTPSANDKSICNYDVPKVMELTVQ